jgi:hypothetical protein
MSQERTIRLRQAVLADLAAAKESFERALQPDQPNVFLWHGEKFWVDRVRRFIVPEASALRVDEGAWVSRDTLPAADFEASELLDLYCGEYQLEDTGSLLRMWARLMAGVGARHMWDLDGAKMLNLAVAQPALNPAFAPLFWLFLADDLGPGPIEDYDDNLFKRVRPMIYLLADYPNLTPSPEEVRSAQIDFLEGMFPESTDASCQQLSDAEWAARCDQQLQLHQKLVDERFFERLLERIGALNEPGALPFE